MHARKRGRPPLNRPMHDSGTPELVMKRAHAATTEALDLCLQREIITAQQHWCGIHLRWLHTLRFGAPGVRAVDPTHLGGMEIKADDPKWRAAREGEYTEALTLLGSQAAALLIGLAIYNERPAFLYPPQRLSDTISLRRAERQRAYFVSGLQMLESLWCRPKIQD